MKDEAQLAPAVPAVSANPAAVEFPRDQYGFTSDLRAIGLSAAGRVLLSQDKLDVYLETLEILAKHGVARFEKNTAAAKAEAAERVRAEQDRAAAEVAAREQSILRLRAELDALTEQTVQAAEGAA